MPCFDRGLQDGLALLDRDLPAIDGQRDGFHKPTMIADRRAGPAAPGRSARRSWRRAPIDLEWRRSPANLTQQGRPDVVARSRQTFRLGPVVEWLLAASFWYVPSRSAR